MYTTEERKKTAARLRALRNKKKLSVSKLSAEIKNKYGVSISPDTIRVWETDIEDNNGRFNKGFGMKVSNLCCLADFFDVTPDYLLGGDLYTEQTNLGLSDKAVDVLTSPPRNIAYKAPDNITTKHITRTEIDGKPGQTVEHYLLNNNFFAFQDTIPRLYIKVINDLLETAPGILTTLSMILYADPTLSRRDQIDKLIVDGFEFLPMKPNGDGSINSFLDDLCDHVLFARKQLQERSKDNG